MQCEQV